MKATVIGEGTLKIPVAKVYGDKPESEWRDLVATEDDWILFGLNVLVCRASDRTVLVDTGVGESHPSRDALERTFPYVEHTSVLIALDELGIEAGDVTDVLISHAHGDHFMGCTVERGGVRVPAFPNARYVMMKPDWNLEGRAPDSSYMLHMPVLEKFGLLSLPDGAFDVAPGVSMIPAPGESPGHALVRFESDGEVAYFLGDLFHDPAEVAHLDWVWAGRDVTRMIASRQALIDAALREDALLVTAHMPFPGIGRILRTKDGQQWQPVT
jgi:glyoxylase-like metal-dependent hydrolase (beta-lactamase superfamily II)